MDDARQNDPQSPPEEPRTDAAPRKRRRLAILSIILLICAVWFALRLQRSYYQAKAVKKIESLDGYVIYDYQGGRTYEPSGPAVVRKIFGDQYFVTILSAHVGGGNVNEASLTQLASDLKPVSIGALYVENVKVGDPMVKPLKQLKGLKRLYISDPLITPAAVKELQDALHPTRVQLK